MTTLKKVFNKAIAFVLLVFTSYMGHTQIVPLNGFVVNHSGTPLIGVNVIIEETNLGTSTDSLGAFSFCKIPDYSFSVKASCVGYYDTIVKANSASNLKIVLNKRIENILEVAVKESNRKRKQISVSYKLIKDEFLKESLASNLMQSLTKIPGVNSMDIGSGISKPMIRGMGFYRVVVAENGIKHEGQIWSSHHGVMIDQNAAEHVEVIKGPSSLQYGSDAIGGVINILPNHVPFSQGAKGSLVLTGKTNNNSFGTSLNVSYRKNDLYTVISLTNTAFGDFSIPKVDSFLLPAPVSASEASHKVQLGQTIPNTAGSEQAFTSVFGVVKKWGNSYFQFSTQAVKNGFFDWQRLKDDSIRLLHNKSERDLQWPYQTIHNFSVKHFTNYFVGKNKLEIAVGYQKNNSQEFDFLLDRTGNRKEDLHDYQSLDNLDLAMNLQSVTGNVNYKLNTIHKNELKIGINSQLIWQSTDGFNHILPDYQKLSSGIYIIDHYKISKNWMLNNGIRFDLNTVDIKASINPDTDFADPVFNEAIAEIYPAISFSCGANYFITKSTTLKANVGKSYRVPSVYELSAYGLHRHEGRFDKGNSANQPEQAYQIDLEFDKQYTKLNFNLSPFVNYFTNYLYLNPSSELRAEGQVYEYLQSKAILSGGEASCSYTYKRKFNISFAAAYVYAVNIDMKKALPFTPPFNANVETYYHFKDVKRLKNNKLGLEWVFAAKQKYTVPNELSTKGYRYVNVLAKTDFVLAKQKIQFIFKIRNLFDVKYYNHISFYRRLRIPEPGRDIQILFNIPF